MGHRGNRVDCHFPPTGIALSVAVKIIKRDTLNGQRCQCAGFISIRQWFRLILGTLGLGQDKPVIAIHKPGEYDCLFCLVALFIAFRVLALQLTGMHNVRAFSPSRTCLPSSFQRMNVAMGPGCSLRALHCISASSWLPTL